MAILAAYAVPHPPLIIPAVGRGEERGIQKTVDAYEEVARRVAAHAPDTIVISTPHTTLYRDYFHISPGVHAAGSFAAFRAAHASYEANYDDEFVRVLSQLCCESGIAAGSDYEREPALDHATMIPLHFIQQHLSDFKLVRIGLSGFDAAEHYRIGMAIQQAAEQLKRRLVYIASGDLSHKLKDDGPYGFVPEGPILDEQICSALSSGNFLSLLSIDPSLAERGAECGLRSFQMMAGALDGTCVTSELLSYEGPFGVGYAVAAFEPTEKPQPDDSRRYLDAYYEHQQIKLQRIREQEDAYVRLARASLESYVQTGRRIVAADVLDGLVTAEDNSAIADLLTTQAGCFVSLNKDGQLRGCIGTIEPTRESLAAEICANAISAGTQDPRFAPLNLSELDQLVYDVDVLGQPEAISSPAELNPKQYGVIVSSPDGRRGLLLPDLDGVESVEEQLSIAAQKAGINLERDEWSLERFEVVRHL
ncbi:MAG: AmmeMemoRadiSam system protein A [Atopobiaceae bacterium]|nr:AmmeMemoRadiSam system protein A [Atopobiaceae bacterium]